MKKMLFVISSIFLVLILSAGSIYALQSPKVEKDVVYCDCQGERLTMDLYYPGSENSPLPVILYIHGGGWYSGDKTSNFAKKDISALTARGYLVAAVNYRLAPGYKFPAQINDLKCAVSFLRKNAAGFGLDPNRLGAFGDSAGGHLAALLGVTDVTCGFDSHTCHSGQSTRVQAVVDMFGPADLTRTFEKDRSLLMEHVFGTSDPGCEAIKEASPVTHVTCDDPPFLIIHGNNDNQVLTEQSKLLHEKLISSNIPASLIIVENCGHNFLPVDGNIKPGRSEISDLIGDFFDRYL